MADGPATAAPTAIEKVPVSMGLMPSSVDEAWRLANFIAKSDLPPKQYRNHPEDVLIGMQFGAEIGLRPMQALLSLMIVNGRPTLWGDAMLALIIASWLYEDHDEWFEVLVAAVETAEERKVREAAKLPLPAVYQRRDGLTLDDLKAESTSAVCMFKRRNKATPVVRRFSVGQAKKAGLLSKDGPWQQYPDRMLAMRARGFAARDAFPDLLRGIHTAEEIRDLPVVDEIRPEPPKLVQRLSERADRAERPDRDAAAAPEPPATTTFGPLTVLRVEHLLGGACATLADGVQVWIPDEADAKELGKFAGTDHALMFTADHDGPWPIAADSWRLVSFEIAH